MKTHIKTMALAISTLVLSNASMAQTPWSGTALTGDSYRTGNVGIGTSSPSEKLDVNGNIVIPFGNFFGTSGTTYKKLLQTGWDARNNDYLSFYTAGANAADMNEKMRITMSGSVGIGIIDPEAKLHVLDDINIGSTLNAKTRLSSVTGNAGGNKVSQSTWLYRSTAGSDWLSVSMHDGISVDASFKNPATDTKTWWRRQPYLDIQTWGNAATTYMSLEQGKLHIGTQKPTSTHADAMLSVDGKMVSKSIYVTSQNWADFVFDKNYQLPKLSEIEVYYKANGHLPLIPTAEDVKTNGIDVGEMNKLLLQKIEELTIIMVEQDKKMQEQESRIKTLEKKN